MPTGIAIVVSILLTLLVSIPTTAVIATNYRKKVVEAKLGNADEKAREIIDEALKTAETKKRKRCLRQKRKPFIPRMS